MQLKVGELERHIVELRTTTQQQSNDDYGDAQYKRVGHEQQQQQPAAMISASSTQAHSSVSQCTGNWVLTSTTTCI